MAYWCLVFSLVCNTQYLSQYFNSHSQRMFVAQSCPTLCNPLNCSAHQAPLSVQFSRQEYRSGLPFPSPGDLPNPGTEPRSPALPQILYCLSHQGSPILFLWECISHSQRNNRMSRKHWLQYFCKWCITWYTSLLSSSNVYLQATGYPGTSGESLRVWVDTGDLSFYSQGDPTEGLVTALRYILCYDFSTIFNFLEELCSFIKTEKDL